MDNNFVDMFIDRSGVVIVDDDGEIYADDIICPYCGSMDGDSWEWEKGEEVDSEYECECGKTFDCSRTISVLYNMAKKELNK